jgi:capsular polysaccharide transport system permease protein
MTKPRIDRFRLTRRVPTVGRAPSTDPAQAPRPQDSGSLHDHISDAISDAGAKDLPFAAGIDDDGFGETSFETARGPHAAPPADSGSPEPYAMAIPGSALVTTADTSTRLPQTAKPAAPVPARRPAPPAQNPNSQAGELLQIQRDIARRRRRRLVRLAARLSFFVLLPTLLAGLYYYLIATPLYASKSEFVIQQSEAQGIGGLGGLFSGTQFATSQDSIAVQGYLQSREAMLRLDQDQQFRAAFSRPEIDAIQRLAADASMETAYKAYQRHVKISYDPTDGVIRMEVIAPNPQLATRFSRALIGYAEEQIDHLTQRMRADQMEGAQQSHESAEAKMLASQRRLVGLQEKFKVMSSETELSLLTAQIGHLEGQLSQDRLSLIQMQSNPQPNAARMEPLKRRIDALESEIAILRARMTSEDAAGISLASVQGELALAQADAQTRQVLLAQSLEQLETARIEANRQVRYLSLSVSPIIPDAPSYPRAFENTAVAFLIFAGIYLMISMTVAILREQVTA